MPFVDWQLSLCTRLRVCTPRHASWPQASPSKPGRPHWWEWPYSKSYFQTRLLTDESQLGQLSAISRQLSVGLHIAAKTWFVVGQLRSENKKRNCVNYYK